MIGDTPLNDFIKSTVKSLIAYKCSIDAKNEERKAEHLQKINENYHIIAATILKKENISSTCNLDDLMKSIADSELIMVGLTIFPSLPVDERKLFTHIFTASLALALDLPDDENFPIIKYILLNQETLDILLHFYDHPELAVSTGEMLRACALHEPLANLMLKDERLSLLFSYFTVSHFDVSTESFSTYKELLTSSPGAETYIETHYGSVVMKIHSLIDENNYTTCIQVLQLIGILIMKYINFQTSYLSDEKNLMLMMKLMLSNYKTIAKEAYHIFKLFVVFEPKPQLVYKLLKNNADKLIPFIPSLITEDDDEEMRAESQDVIAMLEEIKLQ